MRNDLATLGRHTQSGIVTEEEKRLVIVAARLSDVQLKEIARRTGMSGNLVANMVKKLVNKAEKFRQDLRNDPELMRLCGFDTLYPGKVGDTRVDKAMLDHASPVYPGTRRKKRSSVQSRGQTSVPPNTPVLNRVLPRIGSLQNLPLTTRAHGSTLEQSVLACAKYVLDRLEK